MRILVVDDDPAVSGALQRALRLEGYEVTLAGDGPKALEEVAIRPPDAVILDIGLPTIDGLDVCRRMRAAGDDTPVLMLTARDAIDDRVHGLDAGADDYLVKPFALAELLARLRAEPYGQELGQRRAWQHGHQHRLLHECERQHCDLNKPPQQVKRHLASPSLGRKTRKSAMQ